MNIDIYAAMSSEILGRFLADAVYQSLLLVHHHHPQWLQEKIKVYPWTREDFKAKFISQLTEKIGITTSSNETLNKLLSFLSSWLTKDFFTSIYYVDLITNIQNICRYSYIHFFSIILLDAENLCLDNKLENILETVANYPIQGKYAFANWRSLGKKDLDFHQRGYHLIHVPPDKNNADLKMTSLGLSIAIQYPHIKEVFVCSSDRDLHHLSNSLLSHGLKVYRVFRQNNELTVSEINSDRQYHYPLKETVEIMSLADCIIALKEIIQQAGQNSNSSWIQLAKLSQEFNKKYHLSLSQIVYHHYPEKRVRDIFLEHKNDFVVHQVDEQSEIYISLFDLNNQIISPEKGELFPLAIKDFTDWVYNFMANASQNNPNQPVPLYKISGQFYQQYATPITQVTEKIGLGKNLPQALQTLERLQLQKVNKNYQVYLKEATIDGDCIIKSREDFFKIVENLIKELLSRSEQSSVNIGQVGASFWQQYNHPITTIMSQLGLGKKLPSVFKYLPGLQLEKVDNNYFVSLKLK